jgi:hypothetical protein
MEAVSISVPPSGNSMFEIIQMNFMQLEILYINHKSKFSKFPKTICSKIILYVILNTVYISLSFYSIFHRGISDKLLWKIMYTSTQRNIM